MVPIQQFVNLSLLTHLWAPFLSYSHLSFCVFHKGVRFSFQVQGSGFFLRDLSVL